MSLLLRCINNCIVDFIQLKRKLYNLLAWIQLKIKKKIIICFKLMDAFGAGKTVIYIDETNLNLFLRRHFGRDRKWTRCSVKAATSRDKNVYIIIGGICQSGFVYWERRRGSYKKEDWNEWLRALLRIVDEPITNIVIAYDNAPVHVDLENVMNGEELLGCTLLRLARYSAP